MKKIFFVLILLIMLPCKFTYSIENTYDEKIYQEQYESSGAVKLFEELPDDTKKSFDDIGLDEADFNKIMDIDPKSVIKSVLKTAKKKITRYIKFN